MRLRATAAPARRMQSQASARAPSMLTAIPWGGAMPLFLSSSGAPEPSECSLLVEKRSYVPLSFPLARCARRERKQYFDKHSYSL
jgi:hypothetical protein